MQSNFFEINNFTLLSIHEISYVIEKIKLLEKRNILIHIISYSHDNIIVNTLTKNFLEILPQAQVVLLKHQKEDEVSVNVFTLNKDNYVEDISNELLNELHLDSGFKKNDLEVYRNKLFNRYFTDHLTNLPNIYQLRKDLLDNEDYSLIILNIDDFQTINNFYGFIVGDYVIEEVGEYLKNSIENYKVYRISGDEFAILLDKSLGFYDLKEYLDVLSESIRNIVIPYQEIKIYVDLTISSSTNTNSQDIFSKVSMALKYAKERKLPYWIYEDRMNFENEYARNLQLSSIVRDAIENSQIIPYYQAIVDNKTNKIIKYECLARLIDNNNKVISPNIFIPISKKIKIYSSVTVTIIEKSFAMFENNNYEFTLNLSIEDIMNSKIFMFILETLKNSKASNRVTFELVESEAVKDFKKVERFINEVKRYGAKIAIDDFGSGYSNFSYLTKMKADYIKIDGSLIKDIDVDKISYLVVETIVEFAKKLNIKTIAEYVHSSSVMKKVMELDIDYSQGYYFHEPSADCEGCVKEIEDTF